MDDKAVREELVTRRLTGGFEFLSTLESQVRETVVADTGNKEKQINHKQECKDFLNSVFESALSLGVRDARICSGDDDDAHVAGQFR